ncbi:MAG: sulfotransferase [Thermodesulfobacteriota bacterium]|nr:sulfotransferase [Thermodesulfobacteriota bacterium]
MSKHLIPKNYIKAVVSYFAEILPLFLNNWEKRKIQHYGNQPLKFQPVFIIGAPRTGSTILYQTLTNLYDVLYINNTISKFYRNFFWFFGVSNAVFGAKPHNNFQSYHGNTKGLNSPGECGSFWYKWLPKDRHFIDCHDINFKSIEQIRLEISAVINYFGKPLVFKNLSAGQRIRLLIQCFPEAKFIFITRNPIYTAQSVVKAKQNLGLNDNEFWSIMPYNVKELKCLPWYEQIVKQIYFLEKQIVEDSCLIKNGHFFTIYYNRLSVKIVEDLAEKLGFNKREKAKIPDIIINEKQTIPETNFQKLKRQVKSLNWDFIPPDLIS